MVLPDSREACVSCWNNSVEYPFMFFWSHRASAYGEGDEKSAAATLEPGPWCFSQWAPMPLTVDGTAYPTAEHYMMTEKAKLFRDKKALKKIAATDDPAEAKAAGREVRGYVDAIWAAIRYGVVCEGTYVRFAQNPAAATFLMGTKGKILVEASPQDGIWGIGLAEDDEAANDPRTWKGDNLLGFALMDARLRLLREAHAEATSRG